MGTSCSCDRAEVSAVQKNSKKYGANRARQQLEGIVERKLKADAEAVIRVRPMLEEMHVVSVLDVFIEALVREEKHGAITRQVVKDAITLASATYEDVGLAQLCSDLHHSCFAAAPSIAARVFEIKVLLANMRKESLRDLPCFWCPAGLPEDNYSEGSEKLFLGRLKHALRNQVFNYFDNERVGILSLERTIHVLTTLHKIPENCQDWDSLYIVYFIDKHFGTTGGRMERPQFNQVWDMCVDSVLAGGYPLARLGIEPCDLLEEFSHNISGGAMAYLLHKFSQFDAKRQAYLDDSVMEVLAMASEPVSSAKALDMLNRFKHGENGGAETLWKLDNNGDGAVTATEWALFFMRISSGNQQKLLQLSNRLRLHDVNRLMVMRSRGSLRDRYVALFDAVDADGNGVLDVDEMMSLLGVQHKLHLFNEKQQVELAQAQLKEVDRSGDGYISLSEWLRFVQLRGELDDMSARNYHYFDSVYGCYNV